MTETKIYLKTINDVKDFVSIANRYPFDSDIIVGKYVVDAKSIMGLFSLDLSNELTLKICSDDAEDFLYDIKRFQSKSAAQD